MSSLVILLIMFARGWASPMHTQPPINAAVCDNPSFLIYPETGWCYKAGVRGPCRAGEVIISSGVGNIGECKNKRQVMIPHGKIVCSEPGYLLETESGSCYPPDRQGPCRQGELFIESETPGVGECRYRVICLVLYTEYNIRNRRQVIIPIFPFTPFYVF